MNIFFSKHFSESRIPLESSWNVDIDRVIGNWNRSSIRGTRAVYFLPLEKKWPRTQVWLEMFSTWKKDVTLIGVRPTRSPIPVICGKKYFLSERTEGAYWESDSARIRFVACFWPEKISKDVEKVPTDVVLAHSENIFISKTASGTNFRLVEYFLFLDVKIGYILRF